MSSSLPVYVVDDDATTLELVRSVLEAAHLQVQTFTSAELFLASVMRGRAGVLVVDVRLPGISGLDLIERLGREGYALPTIVISMHQDVPTAVRAIKAGALEYLCKPFTRDQLLEAIDGALATAQSVRGERASIAIVTDRLSRLTPREREVFSLVVAGMANKVVASEVGLAEKTVEIHRSHVMKKMEAESFAHLVRMAVQLEQAGVPITPTGARA